MGEYAKFQGQGIKIGTCEDLYYLRADQRELIRGYDFTPDVRYRFPFPDEDTILPGRFEDHNRGVKIPGWKIPEDYTDHSGVQYAANGKQGYLIYLPCPEQFPRDENGGGTTLPNGVRVGFNGYNADPRVVQQRALDGILYTVVSCGGCGAKWRLDPDAASDVVACFREDADRQEWRRQYDYKRDEFKNDYGWEPAHTEDYRRFLHGMADRIEAGYLGLNAIEAGLVTA